MKKNPWLVVGLLVLVVGFFFFGFVGAALKGFWGGSTQVTSVKSTNSILHVKLRGVIMDGEKFLKPLLRYAKDPKVKGVLIEVESPGGVVGPSQLIYEEIKGIRTKLKKPVVVVAPSLIASGAFYAAMAADKIVVMPGTLIGSIGVIMEFVNLEGLYSWAKVSRYSITTGKYKDSGAEYRPLRDDEREVFQKMADQILGQFKKAIEEGRNLPAEKVTEIADGRVFTGEQAIELGLADQIGTIQAAADLTAELAGLGKDYELFKPEAEKPNFLDFIMGQEEEEDYVTKADKIVQKIMRTELANKPLFIMPGAW